MKLTVLRKMRYENTYIYIMHIGRMFQYIFSWDGEIHQDHVMIRSPLWRRLASTLRLTTTYSREVVDNLTETLLCGAMDTIDKINSPEERKKRLKDAISQKKIKDGVRTQCIWQAQESKDGYYYMCLVHKEAVKIKKGDTPIHA